MLKNIVFRLKWGLVIIGVILLLFFGYEVITAMKKPFNIETVMESNLKSGIAMKGDVHFNYGPYEEMYYSTDKDGKNVKEGSRQWSYIIPVGENSFMGVRVYADKLGSEFNKQTKETFDYFNDEYALDPAAVQVEGIVKKMNKEDIKYFKKALAEIGFSESEIDEYTVPLFLDYEDLSIEFLYLPIGLLCLGLGIMLFIVTKRANN